MSNIEIVVRVGLLIVGMCTLVFVFAAARCAWADCEGRKRAQAYRDRQMDCLQMLREERARDDARRERIVQESARFGSSNHPRVWRYEKVPAAPQYEDDFGMSFGARPVGHHDSWED